MIRIFKISLLLLFFVSIFSCKNENKQEDTAGISALEAAVKKQANGENISKLFAAYNEVIYDKKTSRKDLKATLEKAYDLAITQGWKKESIGFTTAYLKEFPVESGNEAKILHLIEF